MSSFEERVALLRSRINDANRMLTEAEAEMEVAIGQLEPVLLGDKRMSSQALDQSFRKLKTARQLVADLEGMLAAAMALPQG